MPRILRKLVGGVPKLIRLGGRFVREGCASLCCGPPPPPPPCDCAPSYTLADCGCGGVTGCCVCAPDYHFSLTGGTFRDFTVSEGVSFTDTHGQTTQCNYSKHERWEESFTLTEVVRCLPDRTVQRDRTGSTYFRRYTNSFTGEDTTSGPHTGDAAWSFYGLFHQGCGFQPCYIPYPGIFSVSARYGCPWGTEFLCCAKSVHESEHLPGVIRSYACGNYPPCQLPCGSYTDTSYDYTWAAHTGCLGGDWSESETSASSFVIDQIVPGGSAAGLGNQQWTAGGSGSWSYANDSFCDPSPCGPPPLTGACCTPYPPPFDTPRGCVETTRRECHRRNGSYRGDGTECDTLQPPCPAVGACCPPSGACVVTSQINCTLGVQGRYLGDGTICPNPTQQPCSGVGACCHGPSDCVLDSAAHCAATGGVYMGDGTDCSTDPCEVINPPTGGCCFPLGFCEVHTPGDCAAAGGTYLGNGTTCVGANCPRLGTCCCAQGNPTPPAVCYENVTEEYCNTHCQAGGVWGFDPAPPCLQFCGIPPSPPPPSPGLSFPPVTRTAGDLLRALVGSPV